MPIAEVNGIRMHYDMRGEGGWIVAISGLLSNTETSQWNLIPALTERRRLLLADHRGGGRSEVPDGPYTIAQIASDWLEIMNLLGIERAPILGNSMGGMVAAEIALNHPERVERLVLSCTTAGADPVMAMLLEHWYEVFELAGPETWARCVTLWATGPKFLNQHNEAVQAQLTNVPAAVSRTGYRGQTDAILSFAPKGRLSALRVPTMVIGGTEDRICRTERVQQLAAGIDGSHLVLLADVGHLAQAEATAAYEHHLCLFLGL